jgi:hypothetical protein
LIELKFKQNSAQLGEVKILMRIIGGLIYFKFNQTPYAESIIKQMTDRGANIQKVKDWIRVDMFFDKEDVRLGGVEFNIKTTSPEEIERILSEFYITQYLKAGFIRE